MRRLTPEEERIVKLIAESERIDLNGLTSNFLDEGLSFEIIKNQGEFSVRAWYNSNELFKKHAGTETIGTIGYAESESRFRKLTTVFELILLLEKNDLILFYSNKKSIVPNSWKRHFIGIELKYQNSVKTNPDTYIFDDAGNKIKYYHRDYNTTFFSEILHKVYVNDIFPSSALKVYVAKKYRTEEQKLNDDTFGFNILADTRAKKSLKLAKNSSIIAAVAVGISALFSGLTLYYSYNHDSKRDKINDNRFKNDSIAEIKNGSIDSVFKSKVVNTIDSIRKDLM